MEPAITRQAPTTCPLGGPLSGMLSGSPRVAGGVFRDGLRARANSMVGAEADAITGAAAGRADHESECAELLNITRPNLVADAHRRLLRTGAELLFTNTSGAAPQVLDRYRVHDEAFSVSYLGAEIASKVAREAIGGGTRPWVIGDVRMPWHMPVHGFITGTEVEEAVASMTSAQVAGGVDAIRLQASRHTAHLVAAFNGVRAGMAEAGRRVPILASIRHDALGRTSDLEESASDPVSAALLAHSMGAMALSIDSVAPAHDRLAALETLATTIDCPLFIAPGAPEATIRRCAASPLTGHRLAFVGVDKPAQAWRLSRFTPTRIQRAPSNFQGRNDNRETLSIPKPPKTGAA
jgi:methionine synthase I (cobalamin-dependent)